MAFQLGWIQTRSSYFVSIRRVWNVDNFQYLDFNVDNFDVLPGELFNKRKELMVISSVIIQFNLTDKFDFDALMFQSIGFPVQGDIYLEFYINQKSH